MEAKNYYILIISDIKSNEDYQIELCTDYEILKDDIINLNEHPNSEYILKDYETLEFIITKRKFYWGENKEEQHFILTMEPLKNNQ